MPCYLPPSNTRAQTAYWTLPYTILTISGTLPNTTDMYGNVCNGVHGKWGCMCVWYTGLWGLWYVQLAGWA